ncbi:MAG: hypothetical protein ABIR98_09320 [Usitatibacter sp.]
MNIGRFVQSAYHRALRMIDEGEDGRVMGTFGTYYRATQMPSPQERETVRILASAAARAIAAGT